jgi:hypothetical protein
VPASREGVEAGTNNRTPGVRGPTFVFLETIIIYLYHFRPSISHYTNESQCFRFSVKVLARLSLWGGGERRGEPGGKKLSPVPEPSGGPAYSYLSLNLFVLRPVHV